MVLQLFFYVRDNVLQLVSWLNYGIIIQRGFKIDFQFRFDTTRFFWSVSHIEHIDTEQKRTDRLH